MNKILIIALLMAIGFTSNAQTFGGIRGKNNAGTQGDIKRTNDALKVADSTALVQITKAADSSYHRQMFKISQLPAITGTVAATQSGAWTMLGNSQVGATFTSTTGIPVVGKVTTSDPSYTNGHANVLSLNERGYLRVVTQGIQVDVKDAPPTYTDGDQSAMNIDTKGRLRVQDTLVKTRMDSLLVYKRADSLILSDIYTATNGTLNAVDGWGAVNYGVMTNNTMKTQIVDAAGDAVSVSTGQLDVRAAQVGTWTVTANVDSSSQRVTHKISEMPTVSIDSSTTRNTMKVLNTVATSLDSSTQRSTIKISSMPSVSVDSTTGSRITQKISELVPLVAGTAYIGKTRLTDGTTDAEVVPLAGYNAGAVAIVDGSGNQITSFGGGTQYAEGNTTDPATGTVALGRYKSSAPTLTDGKMYGLQLDASGNLKVTGSFSATASPTVIYDSSVTATSMTITALNSLANSATAGWKSDTLDLRSRKCSDIKFGIKITMANTAPANDKAVYVYAIPWWYDGSAWYAASGGTTTLPTGGQAAYTIASPNNFRLLGVLAYTTQNMVLQDQFLLSNAFGNVMPDKVQIFVLDYSGAAVHSSGNALYYSPIYKTQR